MFVCKININDFQLLFALIPKGKQLKISLLLGLGANADFQNIQFINKHYLVCKIRLIFLLYKIDIFFLILQSFLAGVAELADAPDLGSGAARRGGSSPFIRTKKINR